MDNIFLREPVDTYYKAHRDRGIIVTSACNNPEETCFCTAFEIDPSEASPASDCCYLGKGDYLYLEAKSEKGEKLLNSLSTLLEDGSTSDLEELKKIYKRKISNSSS